MQKHQGLHSVYPILSNYRGVFMQYLTYVCKVFSFRILFCNNDNNDNSIMIFCNNNVIDKEKGGQEEVAETEARAIGTSISHIGNVLHYYKIYNRQILMIKNHS